MKTKYLILRLSIILNVQIILLSGCRLTETELPPNNLWRAIIIEKNEYMGFTYGEIYFDSLKIFVYDQLSGSGNYIAINEDAAIFYNNLTKIQSVKKQEHYIVNYLRKHFGLRKNEGNEMNIWPLGHYKYDCGDISIDLSNFEKDANCRYYKFINKECLPIDTFHFYSHPIDSTIEKKDFYEPE